MYSKETTEETTTTVYLNVQYFNSQLLYLDSHLGERPFSVFV